jgi:hypothetical protein
MDLRRLATFGGAIGPAAFVSTWVVTGRRSDGYAPLDDAISRLAASGAPTRRLMTAGFTCLGVTLSAFAYLRRDALGATGSTSALVSGLATLSAGFTSLERSPASDAAHLACAVIGYATLSAAPALAAGPLRRHGHPRLAAVAPAAAVLSGLSLAASAWGPKRGLFQRVGLTLGDAWLAATALSLLLRDERVAQAAPATA